ncbi:MAG TPA: hypothetical protein VHG28_17110 [Longimicrobiaceae bacterium]|nr:hypothetical protein [Longimicrobiaceae bacterium]
MTTLASVRTAGLLSLVLLAGATDTLSAQIGGALRGAANRMGNRLPDVSGMLQGRPPITTSLQDAKWAVDSLDNFRPREAYRNIAQLQRTPNGGFVLQPGAYAYQSQSYCLKAGTHGPGGGDGYLFAPPLGPAEEAVMTIVRNSVQHPEIEQSKIQTLLWAIIARAKFEDLSAEHKATAARLLTPQQLATLNRSALDLVPGPALDRAMASMPPLVRQVIEAEARLRQMLINPATSFQQLEAVAVLSGMAPLGEGSRQVPSGRWSLHPDGYYVRYIPSGYSSTRVEVWVPQGSPAVGKEFDPATHIAVPGNTARQRLIQSARFQNTDN